MIAKVLCISLFAALANAQVTSTVSPPATPTVAPPATPTVAPPAPPTNAPVPKASTTAETTSEVLNDSDAQVIEYDQKILAPDGDFYNMATGSYGMPPGYGNLLPPLPIPYGAPRPLIPPAPYGPKWPLIGPITAGPSSYGNPLPLPVAFSKDDQHKDHHETKPEMTYDYAKQNATDTDHVDSASDGTDPDHAEHGHHANHAEHGEHATDPDHAEHGNHANGTDHAEHGDPANQNYSTGMDTYDYDIAVSGSWINEFSAGVFLVLAVF